MSKTRNGFVDRAESSTRPALSDVQPRVEHGYFKASQKNGRAVAERDLESVVQQLASARAQLEAWRTTRYRNGDAVPSYEEQRLLSNIDLLRLQERNVRNWIATFVEQDAAGADIQPFGNATTERKRKAKKPQNSTKAAVKKRSKGSAGRKKKESTARVSSSQGISRTTGKRSRVTLIG